MEHKEKLNLYSCKYIDRAFVTIVKVVFRPFGAHLAHFNSVFIYFIYYYLTLIQAVGICLRSEKGNITSLNLAPTFGGLRNTTLLYILFLDCL